MAMITKAGVATVLGVTVSDISDSVYTWATKQFFILTGLQSADVQKTFRSLMQSSSLVIKLPYTNIKSIDSIKVDNVTQAFTLYTDLKFNPDTGLVWYASGFGGGQLVELTYTINGYTTTDIHDYLVSLLVAKALTLFTPDKISQVKMIKIGNFQKQYGSSASNLEEYQSTLDAEVAKVIAMINGDDGKMSSEFIL